MYILTYPEEAKQKCINLHAVIKISFYRWAWIRVGSDGWNVSVSHWKGQLPVPFVSQSSTGRLPAPSRGHRHGEFSWPVRTPPSGIFRRHSTNVASSHLPRKGGNPAVKWRALLITGTDLKLFEEMTIVIRKTKELTDYKRRFSLLGWGFIYTCICNCNYTYVFYCFKVNACMYTYHPLRCFMFEDYLIINR